MICPHCKKDLGNKIRKYCFKKVPKTYAKIKIKQYLRLCEGVGTKGELDQKRYRDRIQNLQNKEIGHEFPINKIRVSGFHGQEEREAFNYLVCSGMYEKIQKEIEDKKGKKKYIEYFIRIEGEICPFLNMEGITKTKYVSCKFKDSDFMNIFD